MCSTCSQIKGKDVRTLHIPKPSEWHLKKKWEACSETYGCCLLGYLPWYSFEGSSGSIQLGWKWWQDCSFQQVFPFRSPYLQDCIASLRCRHPAQLSQRNRSASSIPKLLALQQPYSCAWRHPRGFLTHLKIISAKNSFTGLWPGSESRGLTGQQDMSFTGRRDWTRQARPKRKQGGDGGGGGNMLVPFSSNQSSSATTPNQTQSLYLLFLARRKE